MNSILALIPFFLIPSLQAEFNPDVRWTCGQNFVSIFVRTEQPFQGAIVTKGTDSEDCQTHGDGANVAALRLSLIDGKCGVVFSPSEDSFHVTVDIRSHPVLIVEDDKTVNVTCRPKFQQRMSPGGYFLEVFDGNYTTNHVRYAGEYRLRLSGTLKQNFTVGQCTASAGGNSSVQLTDRHGCSLLPNLLSHFRRQDSAMTARLPSMFRFPNSNSVTLACRVSPCDDGSCDEVDCQAPDNSAAALLDQTTVSSDVEEEAASVAIVTITVVEKVNPVQVIKSDDLTGKGEVVVPTAEPQCARPADMDLLYGLCIVLTACSALFLTINVFFCCVIWRRRKRKPQQKSLIQQNNATDFWIMEQKPTPQPEMPIDERRISTVSYASVKQKPRRAQIPVIDYAHPASRASDSSSGYGGDHYRRPDPNVRLSNSTFMTPSVTMETDLDSSISSNQTSSYH